MKSLLALLTLAFLVLTLVAMFTSPAKANPFSQAIYRGDEMNPPAQATPPTLHIMAPTDNSTYKQNSINLKLEAIVGQTPHYFPFHVFHALGLTNVIFKADWLENETAITGKSFLSYDYNPSGTSDVFYENFTPNTKGSISCDLRLDGIPDGKHSITVNATERGYYYHTSLIDGGVSFDIYGFSLSTISTVNFTIDTVPVVKFLSFKNTTIDTSEIPLNFTIDQEVANITYSLDKQANTTISGNTTLTGVLNGHHEILLYATDYYDKTGTSKLVSFTVAVLEPPPKPQAVPTSIIAIISTIIVVTSVNIFYYYNKRKRQVKLP